MKVDTIKAEQRDDRWCVVLGGDDREVVHYCTEDEAVALVESFVGLLPEPEVEAETAEDEPVEAAVDPTTGAPVAPLSTGRPWRGVMALVGSTDDGRFFEQFDWRQLPLSLLTQIATAAGAHEGAQVSGRIDWMEIRGRVVLGGGVFNDDEFGQYAAARLEDRSLTGVSVDAVGQGEFRCTNFDTSDPGMPVCTDIVLAFPQATICAATQLATPAFGAATLELVPEGETPDQATTALLRLQAAAEGLLPPDPTFPEPPAVDRSEDALMALVAHAGRPTEIHPPVEPPVEWFSMPEPDVYTPLHITAEGQVYGHVAPWGTCHTGYPGACVTAPPSPSGYALFNSSHGQVVCADGTSVRTGPVTLTTSHADEHLDVTRTLSHYDNTGCAIADVVVTEGVIGPWACGAARDTITPSQIREFNASAPSGDWRPLHGGQLDLVAVLMVNTPGFPPLVASGVKMLEGGRYIQESLILTSVPAGATARPQDALVDRVAILERRLATMELISNAMFARMETAIFDDVASDIEAAMES